jgi:hypothetical protein
LPQRYCLLGSEEPSGLCGRSLDFNQQRRSSDDFALLVLGRFATVTGQRSRILSMAIFYRCPSQRARMPLRFPMLPMLLRHSTSLWPAFVPSQNAHSGAGFHSFTWDFDSPEQEFYPQNVCKVRQKPTIRLQVKEHRYCHLDSSVTLYSILTRSPNSCIV